MKIDITSKQIEEFISSILLIGEDYVQIIKYVVDDYIDLDDFFDEAEVVTIGNVWQLHVDYGNIEEEVRDKERCEMEVDMALMTASCFGLIDRYTACKLQGKFESLMEYSYSDRSYEKWVEDLNRALRSEFSKFLEDKQ